MTACARFQPIIEGRVDDLPPSEAEAFEAHLAECAACAALAGGAEAELAGVARSLGLDVAGVQAPAPAAWGRVDAGLRDVLAREQPGRGDPFEAAPVGPIPTAPVVAARAVPVPTPPVVLELPKPRIRPGRSAPRTGLFLGIAAAAAALVLAVAFPRPAPVRAAPTVVKREMKDENGNKFWLIFNAKDLPGVYDGK